MSFEPVHDPRRVRGGVIDAFASRLVDARQRAAEAASQTLGLEELLAVAARTARGRGKIDVTIGDLLSNADSEEERARIRGLLNIARIDHQEADRARDLERTRAAADAVHAR